MIKLLKFFLLLTVLGIAALAIYYLIWFGMKPARLLNFRKWYSNPQSHPDWAVKANQVCGDAPFRLPTSGYIGFLWGDSFRPGHTHQGLDIFGGQEQGMTPVVAAYDGYLSRLPEWKSSLIIRVPQDPLQPDRQIWTYYTHLAGENGNSFINLAFPAGTREVYVQAGTLLGYQGNFSGTPNHPVGVHLHFSIVKDDGTGKFLNELEFRNTIDPSPYFHLPLNGKENTDTIPVCRAGSE